MCRYTAPSKDIVIESLISLIAKFLLNTVFLKVYMDIVGFLIINGEKSFKTTV